MFLTKGKNSTSPKKYFLRPLSNFRGSKKLIRLVYLLFCTHFTAKCTPLYIIFLLRWIHKLDLLVLYSNIASALYNHQFLLPKEWLVVFLGMFIKQIEMMGKRYQIIDFTWHCIGLYYINTWIMRH